jgi:hypothetical protein
MTKLKKWRKPQATLEARFREPEVARQGKSQVFILTFYHLLKLIKIIEQEEGVKIHKFF